MPRKSKQTIQKKQFEALEKGQISIKEANKSTWKKIIKQFDFLKKEQEALKKEDTARHAKVLKTLNILGEGMKNFEEKAKELILSGGYCGPSNNQNNKEKPACKECSEMESTIEKFEAEKRGQKKIYEDQISKIEQQAEEAMDEIETEHKRELLSITSEKKVLEEQLNLREEETKMLEDALAQGLSNKVSELQAALYKAEQEKEAAIRRADRIAQDVMEFKSQAALQARSMVKETRMRMSKKRKKIWERPLYKRKRSSSRLLIQESRWR